MLKFLYSIEAFSYIITRTKNVKIKNVSGVFLPLYLFYHYQKQIQSKIALFYLESNRFVMTQTVMSPIKGNRPFPHSTPVNTHNKTRSRFHWTTSNKSLYFVNIRLQLVALFTEMQENPIIIDESLYCSALLGS